jgi:precorrin-8X/cobalt-precorrin-8 methylmutase
LKEKIFSFKDFFFDGLQADNSWKGHGMAQEDRPGLVEAGRAIEVESFRIIDEEMKGRHSFGPEEWQVVRRVIHTTGDPDYAGRMHLHPMAISAGVGALLRGASIFADTRMIGTGLSPWRLRWFGSEVVVPALEAESQKWAETLGTTRSVAAFRHFSRQLDGAVVAIGNAPTALLEVIRLIREEAVRPALVIGVPVGFVQAAESKDALQQLADQPSISVQGRKGGSSVAVAIVHALLELAKTKAQ